LSYGTPPPPTDGPYGQQPPYGGGPAPTHGSATTALVLGILSLVVCAPLGIPAYIIGRRAEREIIASQGALSGEGLAKAGWITGLIGMILLVLGILLLILLVAGALVSSDSTFDSSGF
jgi:ABC-type Fe3+ transport system permease subunit